MPQAGRTPRSPYPVQKPRHRITIARGDNVRTIVVRPWLYGSVIVVAAGFLTLYLAATFYLVFRDDLLAASIARQARLQHAYEDRVAALRSDVDRLTSRQLLNQQAFDQRMAELMDRQAALDARQDIIAGISQAARRAGLAEDKPVAAEGKTDKDPDITGSIAPSILDAAPSFAALLRPSAPAEPAPTRPGDRLAAVETSVDQLAGEQTAWLEAIAGEASRKRVRIAAVLKKIGHAVPQRDPDGDAIGGPFIPLDADDGVDSFRSTAAIVATEIEQLAAVRRTAARLPLSRPVASAPVTSTFGPRMDPFLGRRAMHTGIDFKATVGYPIRTTAGGTVARAGYAGGYGLMVEVDHGNGLTTRYAHMSRILVSPGQTVAKGAVVGRAGSTGRSTGPHVHYEVRVDGVAIDPMRYIRAGSEIATAL
jgi:murein DD-endopeptidase MepM/ murein hydrolase activator NlpD